MIHFIAVRQNFKHRTTQWAQNLIEIKVSPPPWILHGSLTKSPTYYAYVQLSQVNFDSDSASIMNGSGRSLMHAYS